MSVAAVACTVRLQRLELYPWSTHQEKNPRIIREDEIAKAAKGGKMARVVALMDDLFFQMKVAETAKHLGLELKVAANGDSLMQLLESAPKLLIVDLNARSGAIGAIERVKAAGNGVRMVGFLSHVQTDLAAQARAAGCDEVMPRSSFTQNLAAILATAKD
jgi:CheY-like chemotaxis protein